MHVKCIIKSILLCSSSAPLLVGFGNWTNILSVQVDFKRCEENDTKSSAGTDVDASARLLLAVDEVLHPVDVVEAEGHGGDEALQRNLDGQTKVLLQQGAGQRSHRLRLFEVHTGEETWPSI